MKRTILAAMLWSAPSAVLYAGGFDSGSAGSAGAAFLRFGAGARAEAMGGAFSAAADDASAVWWNPAGLAGLTGVSLLLSHMGEQDGVNIENAALGVKLGHAALGTALTYLDAGNIEATDASGNPVNSYHPRDYVSTVSFAYDLSFLQIPEGALAVGASGKVFKSRIVEDVSGYAFDLGLIGAKQLAGGGRLRTAAVAQNLGGPLRFDRESAPLPAEFRFGLAFQSASHWLLSAEAALTRGSGPHAGAGAEFGGKVLSGVRGSLRLGLNSLTWSGTSRLNALSAGAGLAFKTVTLDYATALISDAQQRHRVSVGLRFGQDGRAGTQFSNRSAHDDLQAQYSGLIWLD